mmetsp:Transcript_22244/g.36390  ORF Transcript_22244/g.36390 Transcript_22244/m.36390 type:complete len:232 (-) Transcript_22244:344-1039(-)
MVLGCNVASTSAQINTRLVHTTVSVLKFVCLGSGRKSEELVTQTNTKDWTRWFELQRILDTFNCFGAHAWISWSVGEEETIPLNVGRVGFQIVVVWNDGEFDFVRINEVADDVKFHTAIVSDDGGSVLFTVYLNFFCGDFFGEVTFVGIGEHVRFRFSRGGWVHNKVPQKSTNRPNLHSQSPRINSINPRNIIILQPLGQTLMRRPMTMLPRIATHYQTRNMDLITLKVLR